MIIDHAGVTKLDSPKTEQIVGQFRFPLNDWHASDAEFERRSAVLFGGHYPSVGRVRLECGQAAFGRIELKLDQLLAIRMLTVMFGDRTQSLPLHGFDGQAVR